MSLFLLMIGIILFLCIPLSLMKDRHYKKPLLTTYVFLFLCFIFIFLFIVGFFTKFPTFIWDFTLVSLLVFGIVISIVEFRRNKPIMFTAAFFTFLLLIFLLFSNFFSQM